MKQIDPDREKRVTWFSLAAKNTRMQFPHTERDLGRTAAAKACGVSRQRHKEMEDGLVDPAKIKFETMARLCQILGVSMDDVAIELGIIPEKKKRADRIELTASTFSLLVMNKAAVSRVSTFLRAFLKKNELDWQSERDILIFAYGPGAPNESGNVWSLEELPRLKEILAATATELKGSDIGSIARCVSVLTPHPVTPNHIVEIATDSTNKRSSQLITSCLG